MKKRLYIVFLFFCISSLLSGQDVHYSQYNSTVLSLNPALTGIFNGDHRFAGNYRSQWISVPVPYMTFTGAYDTRIRSNKSLNGILGTGVQFFYDQAGDSKLSHTHLSANLAYTHRMAKQHFLGFGVQVGAAQKAFKTDELTFDSQFNGDLFDPGASTNENFPNQNFFYLDFSSGLNYRWQLSERTNLNLGAAAFHLNTPVQTFMNDYNIKLARKWTLSTDISLQLSDKIDIQPSALFQQQGTYREILYGAALRYHLSMDEIRPIRVLFGAWNRWDDAVIAYTGMEYGNLKVGLSYDVNISPLQIATAKRGGPEISVIYILSKVPDLEEYKACPIF